MTKFDLDAYGVTEMTKEEMTLINGGRQIEYIDPVWSGTDNEVRFLAEAIVNGGIMVANGVIWVINRFRR